MKTSKLYIGLMGLAMMFGFTSCTDEDGTSNLTNAIYPSKVELNIPTELQQYLYTDETGTTTLPLIKGETVSLGYNIIPEEVTFKDVTWTSSNKAIASVDDNGSVTALSGAGVGYSIISVMPKPAYSGAGISSTIKVQVSDELKKAEQITVTTDKDEIYVGECANLSASILPADATYRTVKWTSSNTSVATVDMNGVVTGVENSSNHSPVTITATALDNSGVTASIELYVNRIVAPENVTIDQTFSAESGYFCAINEQGVTLNYTTYPEDCTLSQIEWTSSDESIATVKGGVVTFNKNGNFGEFTITARCPETGNSSSVKMNMPAGLHRELFHNQNHYSWYNAQQSGNGTSSSHEWHDGYLTVTTYKQNDTKQRADFKCWDTPVYIHAGNYPIIAIKMDDVLDKYEACTARNINFDTSGECDGNKFSGAVGGGNQKWSTRLKCSDGSYVFVYDFATQNIQNGGLLPTTAVAKFNTFQFKYADIATFTNQITYNVYWIQTFKTLDDVKAYVESEGLSYE